ncbi:putative DNA-directed RNA polymerase [Helianthus annuus]|uniref:DNA-directed RNA polymerase subunit beta n=1 Tax=Helianthus annuus TaxID=4232 RepID=A0A251VMW1_HELAN|nr:DNA-directed RNA polymerases IV and V subunit 2 [Helianthus annuus]XP_021973867.1 DNA-directed RNA polymerases IV and V subunit 2 [Helianthus annuus]KAF5770709.1 putative DNA-directed RNA polymerase [Helianthus annuus]KAJ0465586.1 putative DNA-directed RNA polymerase [Helianthus annuus]KAJ0470446.1 putative DNA-directed RNA polymerase [Helianthus annuus]KAJ0487179.1 putative DNA-directed RNA polymerase [Helianthus annuus]KAJ0661295.1 putative DNA-directed RNA polymerase [Helianthus annuus]
MDLSEDFLDDFCKKASTSFFRQYGLLSHQINSYNEFIKTGIQNVFDSLGEINVQPEFDPSGNETVRRCATVKLGKVNLERPRFWAGENFSTETGTEYLILLPKHARLQNITYSSRMSVQLQYQVYTQEMDKSGIPETEQEHVSNKIILEDNREITIGRLPVMVKSDLCWMSDMKKGDCDFDYGGYFLIKGAEKTFIAQEKTCLKRLWLVNNPIWTVKYRSVIGKERVYVKLVDSRIRGGGKVITVFLFSSIEIPIWLLFFALGVTSDKEVIDLIDTDCKDNTIVNTLLASIYAADQKSKDFRNEGKAFSILSNELKEKWTYTPKQAFKDCIEETLFPKLRGFNRKARFLGYMVKCLLEAYTGRRKVDDRDSFRSKRVELAGELLEREVRVHLKHAVRRMTKALQRDLYGERPLHPIEHYLDASVVTNGLSRAFSTGAWVHPYKRMERISGVVAHLRRANPTQMMADMRRTRQQVQYTGRVGDARYPHPSHWGRVCYMTTPDGENCGLVKNLASTGIVSVNIQVNLLDMLMKSGMEELVDDNSISIGKKHKVFVNGDWVGICANAASLVADFRSKRRKKEVHHQVEIKLDDKNGEVRIFSDAGRIMRPLLLVEGLKNIKLLESGDYSFQSLIDNGIVELIGSEEEEDCYTAWGIKHLFHNTETNAPKYTHCELDMSFLLSFSCGIIPFANHDHAKRVLFQSQKHSQQAIGYSTTNPNIRVDTLAHNLFYPQKPLFKTVLSDCLGTPKYSNGQGLQSRDEYYNGQCAIVAVNVHLGYNQEDSLVMNRASLERGMFRSEHVRSYKAEIYNTESFGKKAKFEDNIVFGKVQSKIGRVDKLEEDGFPYVGARLESGDIVIGKHAESGGDHSIKLKHGEKGSVQKVVISANDDGKNFATVSLRQVRSPSLGDKFSSMHGQKGVLGYLESQENFPFTIQGIVPDVVINPHAFPSRQTPGQLLEAALGKGIALGGSMRYATPFSTPSVEDITNQLHRCGFSRWGNERVYNGRTGEMVESLVFMGPTFYQKLVHMSEDKVKFRNIGPVHPLTRQPVADRKRFGGVKIGEMERDCIIAHGATANLYERLYTLCDASHMHICRKCNNMASVIQRSVPRGPKIRGPYCRFCESVEDVVKVNVPYGAKLICQELFSMGIAISFESELC